MFTQFILCLKLSGRTKGTLNDPHVVPFDQNNPNNHRGIEIHYEEYLEIPQSHEVIAGLQVLKAGGAVQDAGFGSAVVNKMWIMSAHSILLQVKRVPSDTLGGDNAFDSNIKVPANRIDGAYYSGFEKHLKSERTRLLANEEEFNLEYILVVFPKSKQLLPDDTVFSSDGRIHKESVNNVMATVVEARNFVSEGISTVEVSGQKRQIARSYVTTTWFVCVYRKTTAFTSPQPKKDPRDKAKADIFKSMGRGKWMNL